MPYYFQHINLPAGAPFDAPAFRWSTCVGSFIKPVVEAQPGLVYWFSYYDDHFQLCFFTQAYAAIRADMDARMAANGMTWRRQPEAQDTLEGDCARDKFYGYLAKDRTQRANLVLKYLHAISALYIDQLIQRPDGRWMPEPNNDLGNNCDGVIFQSLLHMLCNMTQVPTPVFAFTYNGLPGLESSLTILNHGLQRQQRYDVHF